MTEGIIHKVLIDEDAPVKVGTKLFDVMVDLSGMAAQDCPPVYYFRIVARERAFVRQVLVREGDACSIGVNLAILTTGDIESTSAEQRRPLRVTTVAIVVDPLFG